jgi:RimJ/RimL family protein N-acetyltransferase
LTPVTGRTRHGYVVDLGRLIGADPILEDPITLRRPTLEDRDDLARLMLDAYRGTIDYDGEDLEAALNEVDGYLGGSPMLDMSRVAILEGWVVGAVLVTLWRDEPLIGYVMTVPEHKNKGLATTLLRDSLSALAVEGWSTAHAFITEGNVPSEALFLGVGARRAH